MKRKSTVENPLNLQMPFDKALERLTKVNTKEIEIDLTGKNEASPFIKWAGGKRAIMDTLVRLLPTEFDDYYEPFAGGAALFYEIYPRIDKAYISDSNLNLIMTYAVVKNDPETLITKLEEHARKDSSEYYYKIRSQHNLQDPIGIAARFIYLNKTCYNGLYRVNKKGEFNVPRGSNNNPDIIQRENILASSNALKEVDIKYLEFDRIKPEKNDFVYCDPPYHPTSANGFTKYTTLDFSEKDQERLRDFVLQLHKNGVKVMLSNSDAAFIRSLYIPSIWNVTIVEAPRMVNCKSEGRGSVNELVIRNYS